MSSFWYWRNEIDEITCKRIINLGKNKWESSLLNNFEEILKIRESKVVFTSEQWLYDIVFDYMYTANKNSGWNFEVDAAEDMQITKYDVGGHYDFHPDGDGLTTYKNIENKFLDGKTRKISMTIVLNNDYEGGEFEFLGDEVILKEKAGTIIVFPSYKVHKVRPITKGIRYSLVVWFVGTPFK
tara:strand:- start:144 stop:692 length:549 start_codon:yes stop_codon:yes gene_type:complete